MNPFRKPLIATAQLIVLLAAPVARAQDAPPSPQSTNLAPVAVATPPAQMRDGIVGEVHLFAQQFTLAIGFGGMGTFPLIAGGIFAGYKLDRLIVGAGVDIESYDNNGSPQMTLAVTPGLRYVLVRSTDQRVELFGQLDVPVGHAFNAGMGGAPNPANLEIGLNLAPGIRFWAHPQFAISAVGGLATSWRFDFDHSAHDTAIGVFAGLQALGVF